ncbi:hypothetical protein ACX27_01770 [Nostoc piscinale CENA21]|uniref:Uncharacterized protein n=1 Tax=Nostoc piscinale CENA21 TaxID=224013 RepID=A0A0M4SU61_9NOSO|nr:hypothetical protein [Nostoc piscinale]ALF51859.1 hypothetical protein ACX27_01770 [Nostoc piscinale CENA21]
MARPKKLAEDAKKRQPVHQRERLAEIQPQGQRDGYEQGGLDSSHSSGKNLLSRIESLIGGGDFDPGKVLEAVRMIRDAHLSYVRAHKQRLKTRLDEAEENETDFIKSCDLVEQKIQGFINTTEPLSETED